MKPVRIALATSVLVLASSCGGGDQPAPAGTAPYAALAQGLCQARARAGEPDQARQAFFDNAHQPIHELAAAAAAGDRVAAARLLEAKQAVEGDLAGDPARLGVDIDLLIEATRDALAAVGQPPPRPCQEAS